MMRSIQLKSWMRSAFARIRPGILAGSALLTVAPAACESRRKGNVYAIVGGGAAGVSAAETLRSEQRGRHLEALLKSLVNA